MYERWTNSVEPSPAAALGLQEWSIQDRLRRAKSVFNVSGPISDDRAGLGAGVHHFAVHHGVIHPQAEEMTLLLRMFVSNSDEHGPIPTGRVLWHPAGLAVGTSGDRKREGVMLWTVAVILLVLWALGMGTAYTGGGLVHVLLVIAAIVVVYQFLAGRRTV